MLQGLFKCSVAGPNGQKDRRDQLTLSCYTADIQQLVSVYCSYSQQFLQRPLLEGLVRAVHDVGLKVVGSVVLNNIANVPDHWIVIVTPFKVLKKTENGERGGS